MVELDLNELLGTVQFLAWNILLTTSAQTSVAKNKRAIRFFFFPSPFKYTISRSSLRVSDMGFCGVCAVSVYDVAKKNVVIFIIWHFYANYHRTQCDEKWQTQLDVQLSDVLPHDLRNGTGKCLAYFYPVYFPSIDCSVFCGQVCNLCRADKLYKIYSANLYRLVS